MASTPPEPSDPPVPPPIGRRRRPDWRRRLVLASVVLVALTAGAVLLAREVEKVLEAAERVHCNLGGVAHALHSYQETYGGLPPAIVYSKDGTPLHSWRVLILPFIEEENLYKEFRLDEPWDSPHNIALLPRMPKSYAPPGRKVSKVPPYHTVLHVFVGKGGAFEDNHLSPVRRSAEPGSRIGLKIPDDFPKGTDETLLFVEAGDPVPWTKPQELSGDPDEPLPDWQPLFRKGFRACMVDSRYHFVEKTTDERTLRGLISRMR